MSKSNASAHRALVRVVNATLNEVVVNNAGPGLPPPIEGPPIQRQTWQANMQVQVQADAGNSGVFQGSAGQGFMIPVVDCPMPFPVQLGQLFELTLQAVEVPTAGG